MTSMREDMAIVKTKVSRIEQDVSEIKASMNHLMVKIYTGAGAMSIIISIIMFLLTKRGG